MKHLKLIIISLLSVLIYGCGQNNHDNFLGKYQYTDEFSNTIKILKISKDGDTFLLTDNKKKPLPMKKTNDGLEVNNIVLGISEDKNVLYFSGFFSSNQATRITDAEEKQIIAEQAANELCKKLELEAALIKLDLSFKKDLLKKRITAIQKRAPQGCIIK